MLDSFASVAVMPKIMPAQWVKPHIMTTDWGEEKIECSLLKLILWHFHNKQATMGDKSS